VVAANDSPGCNLMRCLHSAALKGKSHIAAVASTIQRLDSALASCPDILNAAQLAQFGLIKRLHSKGQSALRTLPDAAERDGTLGAFGGSYDSALHWSVMAGSANPLDAGHELDALVALKRRLLIASTTVAMTEIGDPARIRDIAVDLHRKISELEVGSCADKNMAESWVDEEKTAHLRPKPVMTGFPTLDHTTNGGLCVGELTVVGARTSMGKTAFALNMARNAITADGECPKVAYYSYEMSGARLARRMLSAVSSVSLGHIRNGMTEDEREHVTRSLPAINHVYPRTREHHRIGTVSEMCAQITRDAQAGFRVIFVDYIGLVRSDNPDKVRGEALLADVTSRLKDLTVQHNISIVALSQMSRASESRQVKDDEKKPQLSDLRGSGAIEQDADVVILLYRPDYYLNVQGQPKSQTTDGIAIVAKNRDGTRSDEVPLLLTLSCQQIWEKGQVRK